MTGNLRHILFMLLFVFLAQLQPLRAQIRLSDMELTGNWTDKESRRWTFGFFEKFVIYDNAFWNYAAVGEQNGDILMTIVKEGTTGEKQLRIHRNTDRSVTVHDGTVSLGTFVPAEAGFFPAPQKDNSLFPEPLYREDTVTIIGCYLNLDKLSGRNKMHYGSPYFTASIYNPVTGNDDHMLTTVDSLGRFELKFPLRTVQEVLIDWRKIVRRTVMTPGEKIFICVDMLDFVPSGFSESFQSRLEKPRKMWVMGENASFHDEQFHMIFSDIQLPRNGKSVANYFARADSAYTNAQKKLERFISKYPALSEKSIQIENIRQKYMTASQLLSGIASDTALSGADKEQSRVRFDREFPLDQELGFFLSRDAVFYALSYFRLFGGKASDGDLHETLSVVDRLFARPALKELLTAHFYNKYLQVKNKPLSAAELALFRDRVPHSSLRNEVEALHTKYERLSQKRPFHAASLKDSAPYTAYTDAETLLRKLLEPYRGKVVYIDFWGVWCGPCKRQLEFVRPIKEELKNKDVVFMYMANASPEKQWRKMIEDMDLTGEHVVHFNLPAKQQGLLENYLRVNSFPTFVLVDKQGKIADMVAPFPMMKENLLKAINRLLNEQ